MKIDLSMIIVAIIGAISNGIGAYFIGNYWLWGAIAVLTIAVLMVLLLSYSIYLKRDKGGDKKEELPGNLPNKTKVPILIIDDDEGCLNEMKKAFEGMDYDIAISRSLDNIRLTDSFAIIVSDIIGVSLPSDKHSELILNRIKEEKPYKKIIRVSSDSVGDHIKKDGDGLWLESMKKEVDKAIGWMKQPQTYWENIISKELKYRRATDEDIERIRQSFLDFIKTNLVV